MTFARADTAKLLYSLAHNGPFSYIWRKLLAQVGRCPVTLRAIGEGSHASFTLLEQGASEVAAPQWINTEKKVFPGIFPSAAAHLYHDYVTSPYTSGILNSECLLLPRHLISSRGRITTDSGGMFYYDKDLAISNLPKAEKIPEGIHVGGAGSFNWFHFVIECLPKCLLAQRLPEEFAKFPLLLPEECRRIPAFSEALARVSGGRQVLYLKREEFFSVGRLIAIDDVSVSPFNMLDREWPRVQDYSHNNDFMLEFQSFFRSSLLGRSEEEKGSRRIFLVRPEKVRRDYNQAELLDVAQSFGFEPVAPETLELTEQAALFSNADFVVGPSGAAWVGMIYSGSPNGKLKGISWLPQKYNEFCSYSSLAHLLGHDLIFINAQTDRPLQNTRDAYKFDYQVSKNEFKCALQKLVGE